jgi:hypothetical protein
LKIAQFLFSLVAAGAMTYTCFGLAPAATATAAAGQDAPKSFTHEAGGITFDLPEGWTAEPDGEQLTAAPADESVAVVFWVTDEDEFEAAAKALGAELGEKVKNIKFDGDPKAGKHNGMEHAAVSGKGQVDGREVIFSADLLQAKKPVIVLSFGSAESFKKHADEYVQLVKSVRKVG